MATHLKIGSEEKVNNMAVRIFSPHTGRNRMHLMPTNITMPRYIGHCINHHYSFDPILKEPSAVGSLLSNDKNKKIKIKTRGEEEGERHTKEEK